MLKNLIFSLLIPALLIAINLAANLRTHADTVPPTIDERIVLTWTEIEKLPIQKIDKYLAQLAIILSDVPHENQGPGNCIYAGHVSSYLSTSANGALNCQPPTSQAEICGKSFKCARLNEVPCNHLLFGFKSGNTLRSQPMPFCVPAGDLATKECMVQIDSEKGFETGVGLMLRNLKRSGCSPDKDWENFAQATEKICDNSAQEFRSQVCERVRQRAQKLAKEFGATTQIRKPASQEGSSTQ